VSAPPPSAASFGLDGRLFVPSVWCAAPPRRPRPVPQLRSAPGPGAGPLRLPPPRPRAGRPLRPHHSGRPAEPGPLTEDRAPAVVVEGLKKAYGANLAVDGLSFTVERGEVFGLLGPNGAGKTTTVETLEGYRAPDAGTARVLGLDPIRDHAALTPRIGVMLQEGGLYPGIRPLEALRLFAAYYADHEVPEALLDLVGLRPVAGTLVRRLSGGQKQRLSLALALVGKPEVVFLDEPTAGMDPHARLTTWEVVVGLKERGSTVILTTHAMDEAERLCDRVAIIDGGHLVALGTPGDLTRSAGGGETRFTA